VGISDQNGRAHAAFVHAGETRFVFAARRDGTPGLVELEDGTAVARRVATKAELICPVPGCRTPNLTTVNRGAHARDGYRHLTDGTNHAAERMHHVLGKGLLAKWARWAIPGATAIEEHPSNPERERIADVLVTLPNQTRFALEVQYASLSVDAWQERHESYRRQGIVDVWLFGHAGAQSRWRDGIMQLNATQRAIAESGTPVLWLNPLTREVAYATMTAPTRGREVVLAQNEGELHVLPLDRWRLLPDGMFTRELLPVRDATTKYLAEAAAQEAARQAAAVEAAAADEARRRARDRVADARGNDHRAWLNSATRAAALDSLGVWPSWLNGEDPDEVQISGERWRWFLWERIIRPLPPEAPIRSDDLLAALVEEFGDRFFHPSATRSMTSTRNVVIAMLESMMRVSVVEKRRQTRYGRRLFWFERGSVHTPMTPQQRAERAAELTRRDVVRRDKTTEPSGPITDFRRGPGRYTRHTLPSTPPTPRAGETTCTLCGLPVASLLVEQGMLTHPLCGRHRF